MAVAMCGGAHLANLKAYSAKFLGFLTQKVDPESMLRCASITEAQSADRQIWAAIADLMSERGWDMDNCLHEFTHIRHDLPGLLQLRPRPLKITSAPSQPRPSVSEASISALDVTVAPDTPPKEEAMVEMTPGDPKHCVHPNFWMVSRALAVQSFCRFGPINQCVWKFYDVSIN
ncbi:unnamed protein product [Cladocopium goreaui]|uniref:C3H1-type domain-containing protein n=1 Tax=Cladocopium goreaui TaxID=2562237 RepID=A0A9P1CKW6_9DINO|nr:unnamed protein product [Cladocopium goreaui]